MHQFGWLLEREGNFLNLLQKEGVPRKGGGGSLRKGGVPTLEETMDKIIDQLHLLKCIPNVSFKFISCQEICK